MLRHHAAIQSAVRHVRRKYEASVWRSWCCVLGEDDRGVVVRVCYGQLVPPHRKWVIVGADGGIVGELLGFEVERFDEPEWL